MTTAAGWVDTNKAVWVSILIASILMTLKYFPGLENEPAYAGFSFQSIYPNALAGDPFYGPHLSRFEKYFGLSALYLVPWAIGDVWLDDRFIALLYLGLVIAAFVGLDRISVLLGLRGLERIIIVLFFMKDHQLLYNKVLIAHAPDFNHSAVAIPLAIWLIYAGLKRSSWAVIITLSITLAAVSVKNAPFVIGAALLAMAYHGSKHERIAVAASFAAAALFAVFAVTQIIPIETVEERNQIWRILLEGADVTPLYFAFEGMVFYENLITNIIFLGLCLAAVFWPRTEMPSLTAMRLILLFGIILWVLGVIYFNFAPDFLKYPQFIGFPITRLMQWPQILSSLALLAGLLITMRTQLGVKSIAAGLGIVSLFLIGPGSLAIWALAIGGSALGGLLVVAVIRRYDHIALSEIVIGPMTGPRGVIFIIAVAFTGALFLSYGRGIYQRAPAWDHLAKTGVYGDSTTVWWTDIAPYLRAHAKPGSTVLAFRPQGVVPPGGSSLHHNATVATDEAVLVPDRSITTRSGLGGLATHRLAAGIRIEDYQREGRQISATQRLGSALAIADTKEILQALSDLISGPPDYIVLPIHSATALAHTNIPYRVASTHGNMAILERTLGSAHQ